jgi:hypothetical protein
MEGMMNVWGGGLTVVAGMVCANEVAVDVGVDDDGVLEVVMEGMG